MKLNTTNNQPVTINNQQLEEGNEFTYLGSKVSTDGDSGKDVSTRLSKENQAFGLLNPVWRSTKLTLQTKLRIFKSNVLLVLLYGSECWKATKEISRKLDVFQTKCLRRIKRIFWPNKISNKDLLSSCNLEPVSIVVQKRRWRWLGHVLRMRADPVPRVVLRWTPQGKRSRGRPKETWRRTVQKDLLEHGLTMEAARQQAEDRQMWRSLMEAPCATRHYGS